MLFLISIFLLFFGNAHLVPTPDPETALATPASPTESQKPAFADEIMKTEQYLNQVDPIEVLALGRSATFGTIYDAREDSFKEGVSMFTRSETDEKFKPYVTSTENREAKIIYSLERSMADKLKMMDIKAELKVSLMSDTIEVSGSGRYFKDEKKSEKICKAVLLHSISTVYEEVTVTDKDLVDLVDMQALDAGTHVVVGIDWGGNLFLTITDTNKEDKDTQVIEGALSVTMKKASLEISGNATVNITNEEITKRESYMFSLDGDILPDQNPKTLNEVIEFMKNSPEKLRESNNGRGKQVKYTLLPVEALKRLWNKQGKIGIVGTIEKDAVQMAVNVFDQVNKCEQKLNDLNDDKEAFRNYLPNNIITDFEKIYNSFTTYKISLKSRFADEVKKARYGNYVDFKTILNEFKNQEYSHRNILLNYFKLFGPLKQELSFLKLLKGLKVEILHKENYLLDFVFKNEAHDVYVLIYNFDHPNELNDAINVFRMISQNRKDPKYENAVFGVLNYKILATKPPYKEITEKPAVVLFQHQSLADKQVKVDVTGLNDTNVWGMGEMKEILNKMKDRKMHSPDFHYVQYPDMSEPSSIWPQYKWEEVKKYQNAFFRVFKDKVSAPFGSIQEAVNPSVKAKAYVSNNFISGTAPQIGNGKGIFAACPSWDRPCPMHELVPNKPMTIAPFLGNDIKSLTKAKIVNPDNVAPAYHSIRIWKIIQ